MLSEIGAATQLILVLEVAYLMLHCRQFRMSAPDIIEGVEDRHEQALRRWEDLRKLLDEIADGIFSDEGAIAHPPMDLKSMLTAFLMSKTTMPTEHGSEETQREIHEINPPEKEQTEI